jgi:hypothetical protein
MSHIADQIKQVLCNSVQEFQKPFYDIITKLKAHVHKQIDLSRSGLKDTLKKFEAKKTFLDHWYFSYNDEIFGNVRCELNKYDELNEFKSNTIFFIESLGIFEIKDFDKKMNYKISVNRDYSGVTIKKNGSNYQNANGYSFNRDFSECLNDKLYYMVEISPFSREYPSTKEQVEQHAISYGVPVVLSWTKVLNDISSYVDKQLSSKENIRLSSH